MIRTHHNASLQGGWKKVALLLSLFSVIASCNPQKTETQGGGQTEQDIDKVRSMPDYAYTDSVKQGSHKVVYTITSEADSTLKVVEDEDGVKFQDNRFQLRITKDGQKLFERSFTKADFKSQLSEDFRKYGIMDGLRFNRAEEGKLYFNTCVSFPESDMTCPFLLIIGPDGSYRIEPDATFGEEDEEFPSI
ncbi:MAG: DUF4738 domain-containing protein [Bacteroidaceae bacterium]|nr:DUF4738 domain-containing protein [Bacteroidaceae bacterium]